MRIGELRALRWRDVDHERRVIRIERAFSRREIKRPKSDADVRAVPLFASADEALRYVAALPLHDLRHTCVSRLVAAGADVKLVQAVAGHASPLITLKRYSHILDSRITEAADRFDPARETRARQPSD